MSDGSAEMRKLDLGNAAALMALALGMVGVAALLYSLIDLLVVFFLGIVVAAALQPGHVRLCRLGVPKGLAVLLIYLFFIIGIALIVLFLVPMLIEQTRALTASFPEQYANFVKWLHANSTPLLRRLGDRIPPFAVLVQNIAELAPAFFANAIGVVTSTVSFFTYLVIVLAVGFYWTMEVPRVERLILSLVTVARRPQVLNTWHEIEFKLGAYIRGQGLAMLIIGAASAIGYVLIGLPNVLALAVLAGLLEAVPLIGPILAAVPAILVALPLGLTSVLLVIGFAVLLQVFENNVLIPRIMSHAVGISALVGMFAVLALGTLYGILGVFIAIPLTVVVQVLLDRMVINPEPVPEDTTVATSPLTTLRTRVRALRQEMRLRLRGRDTRMGIDPQIPDHVVDATDQQIEQAVERIETMIATAQEGAEPTGPPGEVPLAQVNHATQQMTEAVERVETAVTEAQDNSDSNGTTDTTPSRQDSEQAVQIVKPS
jgi:predicted PurR-regulated permease PerM